MSWYLCGCQRTWQSVLSYLVELRERNQVHRLEPSYWLQALSWLATMTEMLVVLGIVKTSKSESGEISTHTQKHRLGSIFFFLTWAQVFGELISPGQVPCWAKVIKEPTAALRCQIRTVAGLMVQTANVWEKQVTLILQPGTSFSPQHMSFICMYLPHSHYLPPPLTWYPRLSWILNVILNHSSAA